MTYLQFYELCLEKRTVTVGKTYGEFLKDDVHQNTVVIFKFSDGFSHSMGIKAALNAADGYSVSPGLVSIQIINHPRKSAETAVSIQYDHSSITKVSGDYVPNPDAAEYPRQQELFDADAEIDINAGEPTTDDQDARAEAYYKAFGEVHPNAASIEAMGIALGFTKAMDNILEKPSKKDTIEEVEEVFEESLVTIDADEAANILSEELAMRFLQERFPEKSAQDILEDEELEGLAVELMEEFHSLIVSQLYASDLSKLEQSV